MSEQIPDPNLERDWQEFLAAARRGQALWQCKTCRRVAPFRDWATRNGVKECGSCMQHGLVDQLEKVEAAAIR